MESELQTEKEQCATQNNNIDTTYSVTHGNICGQTIGKCELDLNYINIHEQSSMRKLNT